MADEKNEQLELDNFQSDSIAYAKLGADLSTNQNEFYQTIAQNGHHPELKKAFLELCPEPNLKGVSS